MTVIVFSRGIMAADSLACYGAIRLDAHIAKIQRCGRYIVGGSGTISTTSWVMHQILHGRDIQKMPFRKLKDSSFLIYDTVDHRLYYTNNQSRLFPMKNNRSVAIGSGLGPAMGALAVGANAAQAALAAMKIANDCGGNLCVVDCKTARYVEVDFQTRKTLLDTYI